MTCTQCETVAHCMKNGCIPKQPAQQEPVAWMIWTHGPVLVFMNKDEANMEFDRLNHAYPEPMRMLIPLYTSPPAQRKQLTADDVRKAGGIVHSDGNIFFTNIEKLNACIGIKENT